MDATTIQQALPGIAIAAVIAFPMLFFPQWHLLYRLAAAYGAVLVCLAIFGQVLGHQFHFLQPVDILLEVIGVGVAWILSVVGRVVRKSQGKEREGK